MYQHEPYFADEEHEAERLSNSSDVKQLLNGRVRIETQRSGSRVMLLARLGFSLFTGKSF